ncbi:hypothetical protein COOONC_13248 [Cooperia oncophora]
MDGDSYSTNSSANSSNQSVSGTDTSRVNLANFPLLMAALASGVLRATARPPRTRQQHRPWTYHQHQGPAATLALVRRVNLTGELFRGALEESKQGVYKVIRYPDTRSDLVLFV